jgi:UPF0755 protein
MIKIIEIISFVIILAIFVLFYLVQPVKTPKVLFVPKGSTNYIIEELQKNDIDILKFDKYILYFLGYVQSGWIDLKDTKMTKLEFLYRLTTSKAALKKLTIIPGETPYFVYKDISKKFNLDFIKIKENCDSLQYQFIYPDTYYLPLGITENKICNYLVDNSLEKHKKISMKVFNDFNIIKYTKYLIIASIIQKEAANIEEMSLVSSVIYNRLKIRMKLQMDGTLNYGKYSHIKITPDRIKNDNSKFNTYKYYGIPDEIVGFVDKNAIKAAIFPKKTSYLYFVKDGKSHKFSKSYKSHLYNVKK